MEENRDNVSAKERTSERNLRRRTRYAQMSLERKQLFLSELREKRAKSKRQKHLHQSNTTAALTISSSSLSPQEVEASEATSLPVTLTTGHHQSNSTGALTINTSSLSPQQGEHQLNSTGALTIGTSLLFPQEVEASEAINLPVTSTRGESIVNCLSTFEVGSTSSASYAASRSSSSRTSNRGAFFIDGPGGTGKTFLYRALLVVVRTKGFIALATASSGVAASILPGGRTAHSRFKIPVDIDDNFTCNISKQSSLAILIRDSKLIVWDEVSMAKKNMIEALDTLLKDLMNTKALFGGKVVVLGGGGGGFRQTLPVVLSVKKEDFINQSLLYSRIWNHLEKLSLSENMRAKKRSSILCIFNENWKWTRKN
ncbi:ATP-dependent DNA helicase pfh1-like isoform X2 [Solanum lycopersicum]|uniref:ATP-dependent DNA helicase pfh1-like isoform X2 n=1 Tax=Solanum lycopersicum TaxID=4081 RepID=UPI003749B996